MAWREAAENAKAGNWIPLTTQHELPHEDGD